MILLPFADAAKEAIDEPGEAEQMQRKHPIATQDDK
jgi:hypothetical protein